MTATQVFLRFIENEYRNKDGTVNPKMLALWHRELRSNNISARPSPNGGVIPIKTSYGGIRYEVSKVRRSKNFVDDYLNGTSSLSIGESVAYPLKYRRRTLNGFMNHFINFNRYLSYACQYGGWSFSENRKRLNGRWHKFLRDHLVDGQKRYIKYGEKVEYEWKD